MGFAPLPLVFATSLEEDVDVCFLSHSHIIINVNKENVGVSCKFLLLQQSSIAVVASKLDIPEAM